MTSAEHSKFVMAAQQREQDLLTDQHANETIETVIHRSDHSPSHASAPLQTMAPPGIDMGSESGSLELSDSPDKTVGDHRKRRGSVKGRERSPRRTPSTGSRSNRSDSGSRKPPASRTSSVRPGGPTPRNSRPSSRTRASVTPWADDKQAVHRKVVINASEPFGPGFAKGVALQLQADREHMEVLKLAIEGLFLAQQQQSIDLGVDSKRIETTVESVTKLKSACKAHAEQTDERFQWIHENVSPRSPRSSTKLHLDSLTLASRALKPHWPRTWSWWRASTRCAPKKVSTS